MFFVVVVVVVVFGGGGDVRIQELRTSKMENFSQPRGDLAKFSFGVSWQHRDVGVTSVALGYFSDREGRVTISTYFPKKHRFHHSHHHSYYQQTASVGQTVNDHHRFHYLNCSISLWNYAHCDDRRRLMTSPRGTYSIVAPWDRP